ncbi:MAG: methylated-DNA--[protein]-cysteine S-methyltransferase [Gammaproteobacteria bacterium]|jgi:methylated-DNA-[protein]-cysteine S-methyltransferase
MSLISTTINSPIGKIKITISNSKLINIQLAAQSSSSQNDQNKLIQNVISQLQKYFTDANFSFNLPLQPKGTTFQQKVWHALQNIPCGETRTYGELAKQLKTSPRAIGNACRANPIPIIIPCHRVVSQNSDSGFMGKTAGKSLKIKKWLLQHEQLR